jgi:signal transduction histidine kinase
MGPVVGQAADLCIRRSAYTRRSHPGDVGGIGRGADSARADLTYTRAGMRRLWRQAAVAAPAVLFTVTSQYEIWIGPLPLLQGAATGFKPALAASAAAVSVGLALRVRYPLLALFLAMAQMALHGLFPIRGAGLNLFEVFLAEVFMVYSTAAHTSGRRTYIGAGMVAGFQLLAYGPTLPGSLNQAFGEWVFYAIAWTLGKTLQWREQRGNRLEARAVELEAQREREVEAAVADERARIARELHDIVGHSVSLMVLQAGAARQALDAHPEKARAPLLSIETAGRDAMSELRRLVAMLRRPGQDEELAPQPSIRHLDQLVSQISNAGIAVHVDSDGGLEVLPPGVDLSAYRIVQESLTNVVKHSGAKQAELRVRCASGAVEITVEDDGLGVSGDPPTSGHGLIGIQERVKLYGGRFEAGARDGGGFRVFASLPYESA